MSAKAILLVNRQTRDLRKLEKIVRGNINTYLAKMGALGHAEDKPLKANLIADGSGHYVEFKDYSQRFKL